MDVIVSDYLLFTIAIIWLIFASITDLKKREIANWLSFSLLSIALGIRGIFSVMSLKYSYFSYAIFFAFLFFIIANIFYYTKIFAGGDAKLLIALGAVFATKPEFASFDNPFNLAFPVIFLLNNLIVASAYGVLYSSGLAFENRSNFLISLKGVYTKNKRARLPILIMALAGIISFFILRYNEILVITAIIFVFPYLYIFVKAVENTCMVKKISANELTEGDWITHQIKVGNKTINPSAEGLSKDNLDLLRKHHIKLEVKYGIPFVPVFLITAVISVIFGNLFYVIAEYLADFL